MEVILSVNCPDLESVLSVFNRLEKFLPRGGRLHLDISDARFTPNRTWADPEKWKNLIKHLKVKDVSFETHLMVEEPEKVLEPWLRAGTKRAIVHVERLKDEEFIRRACEAYKAEPMLALSPETSVEALRPYFKTWNAYQTLAINPGFAGQKFLPVVLDKIKFLRAEVPRATIEVDGGINLETGMLVKACGATDLVSASYVLDAHDPGAAYCELKEI